MSTPASKSPTLRRVARDPRVTARRVGAREFARGLFRARNPAQFAEALIARHAPRLGLGPLLELILRRAARHALTQTVVHSPVSVRVSPMVTVNLVAARPIQLATQRIEHHVTNELHRLVLPERRIERTFVERLIAREVRHESRTFDATPMGELPRIGRSEKRATLPSLGDVDAPPESPVVRVFRRPAQRVNPESPERSPSPRAAMPAESERLRPPVARSASQRRADPVSPQELSRITDHVIDAIDRRITASRERRGMT